VLRSTVYGIQVYSGIQNSDAIPNIQLIFLASVSERRFQIDLVAVD
jgi:hypothetical protein